MTNNIAVLGLGIHQLNSIRYLKRYYDIIGFDEDVNCPGKKYVKKFFCLGLNKKEKILGICKKNNIKFAATFCNEHFLRLTSRFPLRNVLDFILIQNYGGIIESFLTTQLGWHDLLLFSLLCGLFLVELKRFLDLVGR